MNSEDSDMSIILVYHCWLCSAEFVDKLGLIHHLKVKHTNRLELQGIEKKMKVPICLICGSSDPCEHSRGVKDGDKSDHSLEDENEYDEGKDGDSNVPRPRVLHCATCDLPFTDPISLREHRMKEHPQDKSYQCMFCNTTFIKHSHLVVHTRIHTGSRPYICSQCGNRFPKSSDLKRHARVHSGEKPFQCALCSRTFTQKCSLEKHAKIHGKRIGGHPCLMCGLVFVDLESLGEHSETAHSEVHWKCKTCGKLFAEERHMLLHEKSHIAVKPFPCGSCTRTFASQALLVKHEECIHSSKKEIKCEECGKIFKRRENLGRHMLSHSGVKNYRCDICGMSFTEKGSLTRHTKSQHDLLRPHVCLICARAFTRRFLLRKHMERVHAKKDPTDQSPENVYFRCKLCKKLLKKSGHRQHAKHHRSKGDVWEGDIEESEDTLGQDCGDVEVKEETEEYEEEDYQGGEEESKESEGEEKVEQWDSDTTIDNSDADYWKNCGSAAIADGGFQALQTEAVD